MKQFRKLVCSSCLFMLLSSYGCARTSALKDAEPGKDAPEGDIVAGGDISVATDGNSGGDPVASFSEIYAGEPMRADGIEAATVTIILRDDNNLPVSGIIPTFVASGTGNSIIATCAPTDQAGISLCVGALVSTDAGSKVLSITSPVEKSGGSVEFTPAWVFRSVGPGSTSPLVDSSLGMVDIAGAVATFAAGLPDHVGVGDALVYDSEGKGDLDTLAFVHRRRSASQFDLRDARGLSPVPASTALWSLYRAHISLEDAVERTPNPSIVVEVGSFDDWLTGGDLTLARRVWNIACYADATDRTKANFGTWVTSKTTPIRIFTPVSPAEVGQSQRHQGVWDESRYNLDVSLTGDYAHAITVRTKHVHIDGLQVVGRGGGNIETGGITVPGSIGRDVEVYFSNNIIKGAFTTCTGGGWGLNGSNGTVWAWNNIIYDWVCGSASFCGMNLNRPHHAYIYNNTLVGCRGGFRGPYGPSEPHPVLIYKNNLALGNTAGDYRWYYDPASTHNGSSDASAPPDGAVALSSATPADFFVGGEDFRIEQGAANAGEVIDRGVDLTNDPALEVHDDSRGVVRPQGAGFDLGAMELVP